jgi:hypothetical protein
MGIKICLQKVFYKIHGFKIRHSISSQKVVLKFKFTENENSWKF